MLFCMFDLSFFAFLVFWLFMDVYNVESYSIGVEFRDEQARYYVVDLTILESRIDLTFSSLAYLN